MAAGIQQVGDTGLEMTLEFPDAKMREDFEIAFRGWLKQYQQTAATNRLVNALAVTAANQASAADDEGDTGGFLYSKLTYDKWGRPVYQYVDFIPIF